MRKNKKVSSRKIGLDIGLLIGRFFLNTEDLHYGYWPKEKKSTINTQDNAFGKDRLGVKRMKDTDKNDSDSIRPKFNTSPLALSERDYKLRYEDLLKLVPRNTKKLIFEEDTSKDTFLDESNLKY